MSIKINDKILSIPPYISTNWSRVSALHMKGEELVVTLIDGDTIQIPSLESEEIQTIFHYHAAFLEKEPLDLIEKENINNLNGLMEQIKGGSSIRFAFGPSLENVGLMMQHNPDQADSPPLPEDILQKITMISKIISPMDEVIIPKAVEGCNCFHCQVSRALNPSPVLEINEINEVSDDELKFQQWDIIQTADQLFTVTNRLDTFEKYNVSLREPDIGCTCGIKGCEHLLAVLKS